MVTEGKVYYLCAKNVVKMLLLCLLMFIVLQDNWDSYMRRWDILWRESNDYWKNRWATVATTICASAVHASHWVPNEVALKQVGLSAEEHHGLLVTRGLIFEHMMQPFYGLYGEWRQQKEEEYMALWKAVDD